MFVYREDSPSGCVLIPQVSHAWLAWQLAEHWGNRGFARPAPQAEVLAAVLLHDSAFPEFDESPGLDEKGRIRTLGRIPVDRHLELWRSNVARAGQHSRYTGMLVAAHFGFLTELKAADLLERGETAEARAVHSFRAELERLELAWVEDLRRDPRYERYIKGAGWEHNRQIVAACDKVSLHLCGSLPRPFTVEVLGKTGEPVVVSFESVDERTLRVKPWPLKGDKVRLRCEGKRVPGVSFGSEAELRDTLVNAPTERLTFTLLRSSAATKKE